jgi:hypothetical protein
VLPNEVDSFIKKPKDRGLIGHLALYFRGARRPESTTAMPPNTAFVLPPDPLPQALAIYTVDQSSCSTLLVRIKDTLPKLEKILSRLFQSIFEGEDSFCYRFYKQPIDSAINMKFEDARVVILKSVAKVAFARDSGPLELIENGPAYGREKWL